MLVDEGVLTAAEFEESKAVIRARARSITIARVCYHPLPSRSPR